MRFFGLRPSEMFRGDSGRSIEEEDPMAPGEGPGEPEPPSEPDAPVEGGPAEPPVIEIGPPPIERSPGGGEEPPPPDLPAPTEPAPGEVAVPGGDEGALPAPLPPVPLAPLSPAPAGGLTGLGTFARPGAVGSYRRPRNPGDVYDPRGPGSGAPMIGSSPDFVEAILRKLRERR